MADFAPFAYGGEFRFPDAVEEEQGFPCGPADKKLFNGMFRRIESELREVIVFAGLSPTDADLTQVRQAIEALIAAATGGGTATDYLLMAQARTRMPIFPHAVVTLGAGYGPDATGQMGVTSTGSGNVRVPAGEIIMHRGTFPHTTVLTDFATNPSKTYHLRMDMTTGTLALKDLADVGYNPSALAETHVNFDSIYDDALLARVVTNSSNIPTITNLKNLDRLFHHQVVTGASGAVTGTGNSSYEQTISQNWARTPQNISVSGWVVGGNVPLEVANRVTITLSNRYQIGGHVDSDFEVGDPQWPPAGLTGLLQFNLMG